VVSQVAHPGSSAAGTSKKPAKTATSDQPQ